MRGLRTQEISKFERYISRLQNLMSDKGYVFFLECGFGDQQDFKDMEVESMWGWLVPTDRADEFESEYINHTADNTRKWDAYWSTVQYKINNGKLDLTVKSEKIYY